MGVKRKRKGKKGKQKGRVTREKYKREEKEKR
jgi:hypothetical protein